MGAKGQGGGGNANGREDGGRQEKSAQVKGGYGMRRRRRWRDGWKEGRSLHEGKVRDPNEGQAGGFWFEFEIVQRPRRRTHISSKTLHHPST